MQACLHPYVDGYGHPIRKSSVKNGLFPAGNRYYTGDDERAPQRKIGGGPPAKTENHPRRKPNSAKNEENGDTNYGNP